MRASTRPARMASSSCRAMRARTSPLRLLGLKGVASVIGPATGPGEARRFVYDYALKAGMSAERVEHLRTALDTGEHLDPALAARSAVT